MSQNIPSEISERSRKTPRFGVIQGDDHPSQCYGSFPQRWKSSNMENSQNSTMVWNCSKLLRFILSSSFFSFFKTLGRFDSHDGDKSQAELLFTNDSSTSWWSFEESLHNVKSRVDFRDFANLHFLQFAQPFPIAPHGSEFLPVAPVAKAWIRDEKRPPWRISPGSGHCVPPPSGVRGANHGSASPSAAVSINFQHQMNSWVIEDVSLQNCVERCHRKMPQMLKRFTYCSLLHLWQALICMMASCSNATTRRLPMRSGCRGPGRDMRRRHETSLDFRR